jgi:Lrp/AsnC family transcriptional regulator for asnA, asnC and gidA
LQDEPDQEEKTLERNNYRINHVDRAIINILQENALARPSEIKSKLGMADNYIRKRMRYLLDRNVYSREAVFNPVFLENHTWCSIGISTSTRDIHQVIDEILAFKPVYLAAICLGGFNIIIGAHFQNTDQLHQFVAFDLPSIDGITSTETFIHVIPLKYHRIALNSPLIREKADMQKWRTSNYGDVKRPD